jgi:coenzyme PQQ biosynthesis protein PqqD
MINRESCPKRMAQVIAQKASNDCLLFNMEDGQYFSLNEIGGRIWELCDGEHNLSQIVAALKTEYDAPAGVLENDVAELLQDLQKSKLISCAQNSDTQPQPQELSRGR